MCGSGWPKRSVPTIAAKAAADQGSAGSSVCLSVCPSVSYNLLLLARPVQDASRNHGSPEDTCRIRAGRRPKTSSIHQGSAGSGHGQRGDAMYIPPCSVLRAPLHGLYASVPILYEPAIEKGYIRRHIHIHMVVLLPVYPSSGPSIRLPILHGRPSPRPPAHPSCPSVLLPSPQSFCLILLSLRR